jgi:hypothetical protein
VPTPAVKTLENADPGLTRESVVEGAEQIRDFCCRLCLTPVNLSEDDHRSFETEYYNRVENGEWLRFGEPTSYETSSRQREGAPKTATADRAPPTDR